MSTTTPALPTSVQFNTPFPVRRFTVEEYQRIAYSGLFGEDERFELLEGIITLKMPHKPPHGVSVDLTGEALRIHLPTGWRLRIQSAVTTSDSEPEPDIAVVRGMARDYASRHPGPGDIGLLAEIAESSLHRDREKRRIYARAGIAHYWIINLVDRQVETYSEPTLEGDEPHFLRSQIYQPGQSVPLVIDGQQIGEIPVADLLP